MEVMLCDFFLELMFFNSLSIGVGEVLWFCQTRPTRPTGLTSLTSPTRPTRPTGLTSPTRSDPSDKPQKPSPEPSSGGLDLLVFKSLDYFPKRNLSNFSVAASTILSIVSKMLFTLFTSLSSILLALYFFLQSISIVTTLE